MRPPSKVDRATLNPSSTFPRRFSSGILQSSNSRAVVSVALMPIFFSLRILWKPGESVGMMKAEMPLLRGAPGSVLA